MRVIDYTLEGSATPVQDSYRLVTNLLDPQDAPALELAALYHERWEIEGVFDDFKTHRHANSTGPASRRLAASAAPTRTCVAYLNSIWVKCFSNSSKQGLAEARNGNAANVRD